MKLKDGMKHVDWEIVSPLLKQKGTCSSVYCQNKAFYMKESRNKTGKYYRVYCNQHAKAE